MKYGYLAKWLYADTGTTRKRVSYPYNTRETARTALEDFEKDFPAATHHGHVFTYEEAA